MLPWFQMTQDVRAVSVHLQLKSDLAQTTALRGHPYQWRAKPKSKGSESVWWLSVMALCRNPRRSSKSPRFCTEVIDNMADLGKCEKVCWAMLFRGKENIPVTKSPIQLLIAKQMTNHVTSLMYSLMYYLNRNTCTSMQLFNQQMI